MRKKIGWFYGMLLHFSVLQSAAWNQNGDGDWSIAGSWHPAVVPGEGLDLVAEFGSLITQSTNIGVNGAFNLRTMSFDSGFAYSINQIDSNVLSFNSGTVASLRGTHAINTPISFTGGLNFDVADGSTIVINRATDSASGMVKTGEGILLFSLNGNSYTGSVELREGTFAVASLGGSDTITIQDGAVFQPLGAFSSTRPLILEGIATLFAGQADSPVIAGSITGTGNLSKDGPGLLTLSGASNAYGATIIKEGTLTLTNNAQLGTGDFSISNGGTFFVQEDFIHVPVLNIGDGVLNIAEGVMFRQTGIVAGLGSLIKRGEGVAVFSGNENTHSGSINLQEGVLQAASLGEGGTIILNGGTVFQPLGAFSSGRPFTLQDHPTILVDGADFALLLGDISSTTGFKKEGTGTLRLGGNNSLGTLELNEGTISISDGQQMRGGTIAFKGTSTLATTQDLTGNFTFAMDNGANIGTIDVASDTIFTQMGDIVGAGDLVKQGRGALFLTNSKNTYTGNLLIQEGALGAASLLSGEGSITMEDFTIFAALDGLTSLDRDFVLNGNAALLVNGANTLDFGGTCTGSSGNLFKSGAGTLNLSNSGITYDGQVSVEQGVLRVFEGVSLANANITVLTEGILTGHGAFGPVTVDGGMIAGNGTYASVDLSAGKISPGESIGTINVTGNYAQAPGSVYELEIQGVESDRITVTGTASIADGAILRVLEPTGTIPAGTSYDIFTAAGGIDQLWTAQELVTSIPITLTLEEGSTIARFVIDTTLILNNRDLGEGNPPRVRNYIDSLNLSRRDDLLDLMMIADTLDDKHLRDALNQTHSGLYGAIPLMNFDTSSVVSGILRKQLLHTQLYQDPCAQCSLEYCTNYFWIAPFGFFVHVDEIDQLRGYRDTSGGIVLGYDSALIENQVLMGAYLGYNYSYLAWRQNAGNVDIHQLLFGVRSGFACRGWLFDLATFGGVNLYDSKRRIRYASVDRTATEDHTGGHLSSHFGFVWHDLHFFELFGSCAYHYLHQVDFDEKGAGSLDLHVLERDDHYLRSELGGRFRHVFDMRCGEWNVFTGASWVYKRPLQDGKHTSKFLDYEDLSQELVVDTFDKSMSFISPEFEIGYIGEILACNVLYKGEFGKDYYTNQVVLKMSFDY
ncbi:MAG: autotransporter-associated beta strand repeat-containing protein [Chlamydiota bacterium]